MGEVTHTLSSLRDGLTYLDFDCAELHHLQRPRQRQRHHVRAAKRQAPREPRATRKSWRKVRGESPVRRQTHDRASFSFFRTRTILAGPRKFGRRAKRRTRITIFHLRLSERSRDQRNDTDGAGRLVDCLQRKALERSGCGGRNEDVDVAAIAAGFNVLNFVVAGEYKEKQGHVAQYPDRLLRSSRDGRYD